MKTVMIATSRRSTRIAVPSLLRRLIAASLVAACAVGTAHAGVCTSGFLADLACLSGFVTPQQARQADALHAAVGAPLNQFAPTGPGFRAASQARYAPAPMPVPTPMVRYSQPAIPAAYGQSIAGVQGAYGQPVQTLLGICTAGHLRDPGRVGPVGMPCGPLVGMGGVWPGIFM